MKTHEEIKKGLEYLSCTNVAEKVERAKQGLSYAYAEDIAADAIALIQQLEYALLLMINQYCREKDYVTHLCMMAGEHAFAALGIEDYCDIDKIEKMLDEMEGPT